MVRFVSQQAPFLVFEEEDKATRKLIEIISSVGWRLIGPVFDAMIAVPGGYSALGAEDAVREPFEADAGLKLRSKALTLFFSTSSSLTPLPKKTTSADICAVCPGHPFIFETS